MHHHLKLHSRQLMMYLEGIEDGGYYVEAEHPAFGAGGTAEVVVESHFENFFLSSIAHFLKNIASSSNVVCLLDIIGILPMIIVLAFANRA